MRHPNSLLLAMILLVGVMVQPAFGQTAQHRQLQALEELGIYPYPSEEEVNDSVFSSEGFVVEPLSTDDINKNFSNIEDLSWLEPIANAHQVILIGENHYFQYIQHLRNRILFALNTFDTYPVLILERQYSMTPFANYYLLLKDEQEAKAFEEEFETFFMDDSDFHLFQHLRRWNKTHPDRIIQVGCSDIEHDYSLTFQQILRPYFVSLQRACLADAEKFPGDVERVLQELERIFKTKRIHSLDDLNNAFCPLEALVSVAKERQFVGKYPFLTSLYIENVIENLKSYYLAKTQDFSQYRQQAIVRNLTDERFLGKAFNTGKVVIHAGAYHTPTHYPYPTGENFLREGSYLTYECDLTKGRTYSLFLRGLAISSAMEINDLDENDLGGLGSGYRRIVTQIHRAAEQGLLAPETAYAVKDSPQPPDSPGMGEIDKLILNLCYQYQNQPLLFQQIPWDRLFKQAKHVSTEHYKDMVQFQEGFQGHDLHILIPTSPLVKPRKQGK